MKPAEIIRETCLKPFGTVLSGTKRTGEPSGKPSGTVLSGPKETARVVLSGPKETARVVQKNRENRPKWFSGSGQENNMIETDKREVYRYLGYRKNMPDEAVVRLVDECLEDLQSVVTPRYIYREYPIQSVYPAGGSAAQIPLLRIAGMEISSRSLLRNLRGCESVCLMGTTLGLGPDRLIARASVKHMSRAVILQAAAAAMIEAWTDRVNR